MSQSNKEIEPINIEENIMASTSLDTPLTFYYDQLTPTDRVAIFLILSILSCSLFYLTCKANKKKLVLFHVVVFVAGAFLILHEGTDTDNVAMTLERDMHLENYVNTRNELEVARRQNDLPAIHQLEADSEVLERKLRQIEDMMSAEVKVPYIVRSLKSLAQTDLSLITSKTDVNEQIESLKRDHSRLKEEVDDIQNTLAVLNSSIKRILEYF